MDHRVTLREVERTSAGTRAVRLAFVTDIEMVAPVPVLGIGPRGLIYPLRRDSTSSVRLVGVETRPRS